MPDPISLPALDGLLDHIPPNRDECAALLRLARAGVEIIVPDHRHQAKMRGLDACDCVFCEAARALDLSAITPAPSAGEEGE